MFSAQNGRGSRRLYTVLLRGRLFVPKYAEATATVRNAGQSASGAFEMEQCREDRNFSTGRREETDVTKETFRSGRIL